MLLASTPEPSEIGFAVIEILHISGFIVAIGTTAAVDLRILGLGLVQQKPSQISRSISWWMLSGLLVAIFTGFGLYSTDPDMYVTNWSFLIKMAILTAAIVLNYTVHRRIVNTDSTSGFAKLVAVLSLGLWGSVVFGGIFIAFVRGGL